MQVYYVHLVYKDMQSIDQELCLVVSVDLILVCTSTSLGLILPSDLHKVQAQALLAPTAHPSVRVNRAANQPTRLLLKSEIDGGGGRGEYPAAGGRRRHSPSLERRRVGKGRWRWRRRWLKLRQAPGSRPDIDFEANNPKANKRIHTGY